MKIVCLLKQVPHPTAIEFDEKTKTLKREGVPLVLNPFDRTAVAEAVQLRERAGGEVVTMTMGPPQAADALRETLGMGADRAVHLSDRVFAVADTIGTSRTLALALAKLGFDLVLCGRKTIDSETWQVPPEVAAFLGAPHLTNVLSLEPTDGGLRVVRETDFGEVEYDVAVPAVVSVARALPEASSEPADGPITVWTGEDLVGDLRPNDKRFGQTGSPTRVLAVRDVTPERAGRGAATLDEAVSIIRTLLEERAPPVTSWEKPGHTADEPAASFDCWTLVEIAGAEPTRHSLELLARGRELAGKLGGTNVALIAGYPLEHAVLRSVAHGAEAVVAIEDPPLAAYEPERWTRALREVLVARRPHVLLIPASAFGRDVGPRLAGELELGMTGDCVGVDIAKAGRLLQQKPAYGGNIVSVIMGATTPQLATVRARMYEPLEPREGLEAEVEYLRASDGADRESRVQMRDRRESGDGVHVDAAETVLVVGSGVGADGVAELSELPVAVGGTHEVCRAGRLPGRLEIGLYGRPVAPRVLIAAGLDGRMEDLAGFVKAAVVVAIGTDSAKWADVSVAGEPRELVPPLAALASP